MAYSYKGSISFGFVYIPITLYLAVKSNQIQFNLLDKKTKSRIKYKKTCVNCDDKELKNNDIVKGFEYEEGKYVIFEDSDFNKLKSKKDKNITIEQFINLNEIDPIYFDKSFYVVPTGAQKAYQLLLKAMEEENKAGIAKAVFNNKENLIMIRSKNKEMLLNTLYYHDEIINNPYKKENENIKSDELKLAKSLIKQMSSPLKIEKYKDEYKIKLQQAIESKIQGKEIIQSKDKNDKSISDLMDALKESLEKYKISKRKIITPQKKGNKPSARA